MKSAIRIIIVVAACAALLRADDGKPDGPATVYTFGASGDGQADDRDAIARTCAAGGTIVFPEGTYRVSRSVPVTAPNGLTLRGEPGAVIVYPSDDETVKAAGTALSDSMARAAFCLTDCKGVRVEGLSFRGGSSPDITVNLGPAVYARASEDVHLRDCRLDGGGSLFAQDPNPTDLGARLTDCTSYGARNAVTIGSDAVISGCRFEQPDDKGYDRVDGTHGSSHAIYVFAGRRNIVIRGCTFKNIRTTGVKVSGSALPILGVVVSDCVFDDCGCGVLFGADDVQEHAGFVCSGNLFRDCATNRPGWNSGGGALTILGSRGVVVSGNVFDYTRDNLGTPGACKGIYVGRYTDAKGPSGSPVEDVTITGNVFTARLGPGSVSYPGQVLTAAIQLDDIGQGASGGSAIVSSNTIGPVAAQGVAANRCQGLALRGNVFRGAVTAVMLARNPDAVASGNTLIRTPTTSSNAQFRVAGDVTPMVCESIGPWTYAGVKPVESGPGPAGPPGKDGKDATPALPRIRTVQTVTIPGGKTSVVVEHGLRGQPALEDIGFFPDGPGPIWVSKITPTSLTVQIATPAPVGGRKFTVSASRQP